MRAAVILVFASILLGLPGCTTANPDPDEVDPITPTLAPKIEDLAERTMRVELQVTSTSARQRRAVETWFVEALAQSAWLDVASGEDALPEDRPGIVIRGTLDPAGLSVLTTTLQKPGAGPTALAGVRDVRWPELVAAIDRLAIETRRTLGEPIESIRRDARPAMALVSRDMRVAAACGHARELLAKRRLPLADATLRQAIQRDPGCALAHSLAAGTRLDLGRPASAVDYARKALALEQRLSPSAAQRSARVVLMAEGADADRLLTLADETLRARPHDAQARFTKGLAFALAGRYAEAKPVLEGLLERYPASPGLLFSLGHARLGTGDVDGATELLEAIDARVPELPASRFRAFVLLAKKDHSGLRRLFDRLANRPGFRNSRAQLVLVSMRASEAILSNRDDAAARHLLEYLDRLRAQPQVLRDRPTILVEAVWTLARLGQAERAQRALAELRGPKGFAAPVRAHAALANGILDLARGKPVDAKRILNIEHLGDLHAARRLEGLAFKQRGKIERALLSLRAATPGSQDPTLVHEIAECENLAGRLERAKKLQDDLRTELDRPRLDAPSEHPLVRPSYAFVLRTVRNDG